MSVARKHAGNPLGDVQAESDHSMLDVAFYTTPDYLSLIETSDKTIVVGRRGSGKSALAYQLFKHCHSVEKTRVLQISLEQDQVIGLGPLIGQLFGEQYRLICAGCRLSWRYCLSMEVALELSPYYKFAKADNTGILARHLNKWRKLGNTASYRFRRFLQTLVGTGERPEQLIAELSSKVELHAVESALEKTIKDLKFNCIILIDNLDEGYEPSPIGVGLVDGIVDGTVHVHAKHSGIQATLFIRDNMFRTMAKRHPDFSRNIESQVLHLHWDEYQLMNMVCNRLRVAFNVSKERTNDVWGGMCCTWS